MKNIKENTIVDQKERDGILEDKNNIIISASAGSGKTTIMINKIEQVINEISDHKIVAAITFTTKATEEIRKKGAYIKKKFEVMTNDKFIELEIIRPFLIDVMGNKFSSDFLVSYEDIHKFTDSKAGLKQLCQKNILGVYRNPQVNFKFKLALYILENSLAAQQYLKAKYNMIFIDEYQDSDQDMHTLFLKLKNDLNIKLFIVGDEKQAIYKWRGAMSNILNLLKADTSFSYYKLVHNFRSHIDIQNYANFFHDFIYFQEQNSRVNNVVLINYKNIKESFTSLVHQNIIDLNKEITIIANFNADIKLISNSLRELDFNFIYIPITELDESIQPPVANILKNLAYYSKNENYSVYDFLSDIFYSEQTRHIAKEIDNIIYCLKSDSLLNENIINESLQNLFLYLGVPIDSRDIKIFFDCINNPEYINAFKIQNDKYKVMTVFGTKGLEFDQVITFSNYYSIYNNIPSNNQIENHYVSITRAKEKFVMLLKDDNYLKYIQTSMNYRKIKNLFKYLPDQI